MIKKGGFTTIALEDLKGINRHGYFVYTNADESGENKEHYISLTPDNIEGIDTVLMETGYEFIPDRGQPQDLLFWMTRNEGSENLRYHPVADFDRNFEQEIESLEMKMRIDFFRLSETSVYDVVKKLIESGYEVIVPGINEMIVSKWIHFSPQDGGYVVNELH